MKLILTQEVAGLGSPGDVVEVKDGYGRNFLVPRGYAMAWTKGGEKQVLVTPRTSVVSFEPASRSDLKPGAGVFVNSAERQPDGTYTAPRVNVGLHGQNPPM